MTFRQVILGGVAAGVLFSAGIVLAADYGTTSPPSGVTGSIGPNSTPVADLPNASTALASAEVRSLNGTPIGMVQKVVNGKDGKPKKVEVSLNNDTRTRKASKISLDARAVSFDANNKVAVSWLTDSELRSLRAAQH